jgi:hypothetical protein
LWPQLWPSQCGTWGFNTNDMPCYTKFVWPLFFHIIKKNKTLQKLWPPKNFMYNRKSVRHTRIVEYETVYFPNAVKYEESQQKRIRGLLKTELKTQLSWYHSVAIQEKSFLANDIESDCQIAFGTIISLINFWSNQMLLMPKKWEFLSNSLKKIKLEWSQKRQKAY